MLVTGVPLIAESGPMYLPVLDGYPAAELQTGPTDYVTILEASIASFDWNGAGSAAGRINWGLGVPGTKGNGIANLGLTKEHAGLTNSDPRFSVFTFWSTLPTSPTSFIRRATTNLLPQRSIRTCTAIFQFPNGLKLLPSSSLVFWVISAAVGSQFSTRYAPTFIVDA